MNKLHMPHVFKMYLDIVNKKQSLHYECILSLYFFYGTYHSSCSLYIYICYFFPLIFMYKESHFHFIPIRMAKTKKVSDTRAQQIHI